MVIEYFATHITTAALAISSLPGTGLRVNIIHIITQTTA